mgnify:CR=1 FL=1
MRTANWRTLKCEPQTANCRCEPTAKMRTEKMRTMCEWFDTMLRIIRHSEYAPVSKHMRLRRQMDLKVNSNPTAFTVACIGLAVQSIFVYLWHWASRACQPVAHARHLHAVFLHTVHRRPQWLPLLAPAADAIPFIWFIINTWASCDCSKLFTIT